MLFHETYMMIWSDWPADMFLSVQLDLTFLTSRDCSLLHVFLKLPWSGKPVFLLVVRISNFAISSAIRAEIHSALIPLSVSSIFLTFHQWSMKSCFYLVWIFTCVLQMLMNISVGHVGSNRKETSQTFFWILFLSFLCKIRNNAHILCDSLIQSRESKTHCTR